MTEQNIEKTVLNTSKVQAIKSITPVKYKWARKLYKYGDSNFWLPSVVTMNNDIADYEEASPAVKNAYERTLGYLNAADVAAIGNINRAVSAKIAAPEIESLLAQIGYQEANHSNSYLYLLESLRMDADKQNEINHMYLRYPAMLDKINYTNEMVSSIIALPDEDMTDEQIEEFVHGYLFFSQIFEGCFFLAGFTPILAMNNVGKFVDTSTMLAYIRRDEEHLHVNAGLLTINQILREHPKVKIRQERVHEMLLRANALEIKYIEMVMPDGLRGYSIDDHMQYFRYLCNRVCHKFDLDMIFDPADSQTLRWVRTATSKALSNSFEVRGIEYDVGTDIRNTFPD